MKQKKKKQKEKAPFKKTSYIGVLTFVIAGLISIISVRYASRIALPSEHNLTVTLPPSPSPIATMAPAPALPSPSPEPTPMPEAAPVVSQPEPFCMARPSEGDIIKPFSVDTLLYSQTMSDWRAHTGIDFSAVTGAKVTAAADGIVERAYQDPLMGYTIVIAHQDNFRTIYQNLADADTVSEGDSVTKGQELGEAGNSAPTELLDVPHLHFSLTQNGDIVNPLDYFSFDN